MRRNRAERIQEFLRFFVQSQLKRTRDCVVYLYDPAPPDPATAEQISKLRKSDPATDAHAGERETSTLLYLRPVLVHLDRAKSESGANKQRLSIPDRSRHLADARCSCEPGQDRSGWA